jgi:hypothetical protein
VSQPAAQLTTGTVAAAVADPMNPKFVLAPAASEPF